MTFAHALKQWLRQRELKLQEEEYSDVSPFVENNMAQGSTQTGQYGSIDVNWPELDKAIDEFCAEMGCPECRETLTRGVVEKR